MPRIDFLYKGLLDRDMVAFCSPPINARPARLYFLNICHLWELYPLFLPVRAQPKYIPSLDYWLQPIMKGLLSYLKDTTQLINKLKELSIKPWLQSTRSLSIHTSHTRKAFKHA